MRMAGPLSSRIAGRISDPHTRSQGVGAPAWVKGRNHFDFANDRHWKDGGLVSRASVLSGSGGEPGTVIDATGALVSINAPRIADGRGLLIEAAGPQVNQRSNDYSNAVWTKEGVLEGTRATNFTPIMEIGGASFHRISKVSNHDVVSGSVYTVSHVLQPVGATRYVGIRTAWDGGNKNIGFDLQTVTTTFVSAGFTAGIVKIGSTYVLWFTRASASTSSPNISLFFSNVAVSSDVAPPSYAGNVSNGILLGNVDIYAGSKVLSSVFRPDVATVVRTADADVIDLSVGDAADLTIVFDDSSTQIIPDVPGGPYAIPTNLNRPLVSEMYWGSL